ncbi:pilus assembly protein HofN [Enterobacter sp. ECC-175]|uniref:PilN domain-containing protein n=1 Tax=Enterobacter sp. ECC-175 TaxID=3116479 RepID=UPI00375518BB
MRTANLFPWRPRRQARCLRVWGGIVAATLLAIVAIIGALRADRALTLRAQNSVVAGVSEVNRTLAARRAQWGSTQTQAVEPTLPPVPWTAALASVAGALPPQAWLSELRYQPPSLVLTGYATALPALSALRGELGKIVGFTPGKTGELQQDAEGRWMFTFQVKSRG